RRPGKVAGKHSDLFNVSGLSRRCEIRHRHVFDQPLWKWCHGMLLCEKWNLLQAAAPSFRNEPCLERRVSDASMVAVSSQCRRSTFRSSPYRDSGLVQNALCDFATARETPQMAAVYVSYGV